MLRVLWIALLLVGGIALAVPINYTLPADGTVSLAVYDAEGRQVRELLRGVAQKKGPQVQQWDGLDRDGKIVPAGTYSWNLVQSTGLHAEYLLTIGSSTLQQWPGQYGAPTALAVDAGAVFLAAGQSGLPPQVVKFTLDGKWLWAAPALADSFRVDDIAVDGNRLYVLGRARVDNTEQCTLHVLDATTGEVLRSWPMNQYGSPNRVAVREEMLLVAAPTGQITWLNPDDGKTFSDVRLPAGSIADFTICFNGNLLILNGNRLARLSWRSRLPDDIFSGLTSPRRIAIDRNTENIYIAEDGNSRQVKRYNLDLNLLQVYGREGGRAAGAYDPESFHSITGIAVDGKGGFVVVEASVPFRVAHFDGDGKLLNEWFGGMPPQTHCVPDPEKPDRLWLAPAPGWLLQAEVDYTRKTWRPRATYHWTDSLPAGLLSATDVPAVHHLMHADLDGNGQQETYLWFEEISGLLLRVNEQAGKLQPLALMDVIDERYTATLNETLTKPLAPPERFYRWKISGTVQWAAGKAGEGGVVEVLDKAGMPIISFELYRGGPRAGVTADAGQAGYLVFNDKELMHEGSDRWALTAQAQPFSITVGGNAQLSFGNGMTLSRPSLGGNWLAPATVRLRSIHGGKVVLTDVAIDYTYRSTTQTEKIDLTDVQWVRAPLEPAVWAEAIRLSGQDPVDPAVRAQHRAFTWADANGDYVPQPEEITLTRGLTAPGETLYLDDKLNLYQRAAANGQGYRVYTPVRRTKSGTPIWDWARSHDGNTPPAGRALTLQADAKGNLYQAFTEAKNGIIAKYDPHGKPLWQAAVNELADPAMPLRAVGEVNACVAFAGGGAVQFWTEEGLYLGEAAVPGAKTGLHGSSLVKMANGDVLFCAYGENGLPVYRLTGWERLHRSKGTLTVNAQ